MPLILAAASGPWSREMAAIPSARSGETARSAAGLASAQRANRLPRSPTVPVACSTRSAAGSVVIRAATSSSSPGICCPPRSNPSSSTFAAREAVDWRATRASSSSLRVMFSRATVSYRPRLTRLSTAGRSLTRARLGPSCAANWLIPCAASADSLAVVAMKRSSPSVAQRRAQLGRELHQPAKLRNSQEGVAELALHSLQRFAQLPGVGAAQQLGQPGDGAAALRGALHQPAVGLAGAAGALDEGG